MIKPTVLGILLILICSPAQAGGLTKTITLPNGTTRQVTVLVPEAKARQLEGRGYRRAGPLTNRQEAARYRDGICRLAANPPPRAKAPFAQMCADATSAIAEMK